MVGHSTRIWAAVDEVGIESVKVAYMKIPILSREYL